MTTFNFIKILSLPALFMIAIVSFVSYMAWKEYKINDELVERSLSGNPIAIKILVKYEKPWRLDKRIVYKALDGNVHAIRVLGLESEPE